MESNEKKNEILSQDETMRQDINFYMKTLGVKELTVLYKVAKGLHQNMGR